MPKRNPWWWRTAFVVGTLLVGSCAPIESSSEVRQAVDGMERATGYRPPWAALPEIQELRVDASGVVTLDQAISLAMTNNRGLRGDLEVIGQAKAELVQAGLLSNPTFNILGAMPEGGGRARLDFGLSKDFADLWLLPIRVHGAKDVLQQRILSFTDSAIALVTEVRTEYSIAQYQWLAAELQEQYLKILQDSMDIAEARLRAGDATQLDVNLIRSSYLTSQLDLVQFRSDYRVTQRTLLRLMGVARAPDDWRPESLELTAPLAPLTAEENELVELALGQRFDAQAGLNELEAAMQDLEQQKWRVIQSVGIGVGGERVESRALAGRKILNDTVKSSVAAGQLAAPDIQPRSERRSERAREINLVLGPSLDIPLPIFDQNQAMIAKAWYRAKELQRRYEETQEKVIEGVRTALTNRRVAEERARIYHESVLPLQQTNLVLAQTQYRSGQESILTVLLAQGSLITAQLGYAAALRDLAVGTANLERQISGRLSAEQMAPTSQPTTVPMASRNSEPAYAGSPPFVKVEPVAADESAPCEEETTETPERVAESMEPVSPR